MSSEQLFNIYLLFIGVWLLLDLVTCALVIILELQFEQFLDMIGDVTKVLQNIQGSSRKEEYQYDEQPNCVFESSGTEEKPPS